MITASAQTETNADVTFIADDLREIWEGAGEQRKSFKAYQELLVRKVAFPGHIGIMWSMAAAARCHQLVRKFPREKFVVFSTYPPLGVIPAGLMAYLRDRLPWIADFRDPLSSGLGDAFVSAKQRFWNNQLEARVFRQAGAVIANVEGAAEMWRKRYPRSARKLHVISNGFDPEDAPQRETRFRRVRRDSLCTRAACITDARRMRSSSHWLGCARVERLKRWGQRFCWWATST